MGTWPVVVNRVRHVGLASALVILIYWPVTAFRVNNWPATGVIELMLTNAVARVRVIAPVCGEPEVPLARTWPAVPVMLVSRAVLVETTPFVA